MFKSGDIFAISQQAHENKPSVTKLTKKASKACNENTAFSNNSHDLKLPVTQP
jgi:hypothetical protein